MELLSEAAAAVDIPAQLLPKTQVLSRCGVDVLLMSPLPKMDGKAGG
jgi:hypothetical protein